MWEKLEYSFVGNFQKLHTNQTRGVTSVWKHILGIISLKEESQSRVSMTLLYAKTSWRSTSKLRLV
jgi:hypothetical protein